MLDLTGNLSSQQKEGNFLIIDYLIQFKGH
jgi:hypothetical protein